MKKLHIINVCTEIQICKYKTKIYIHIKVKVTILNHFLPGWNYNIDNYVYINLHV